MIKASIIYKEVNNTEVGAAGTNDSYILVTNGLTINDIFNEPNVFETFKSLNNGNDYSIRYTSGNETRIIGLGPFYRDHKAQAGDLVVLEKRIQNENIIRNIKIVKKENSIFLKKFKNGYELLTPNKLSLMNDNTKIFVNGCDYFLSIKKIDSQKKRQDSPEATDIYQLYYGENEITEIGKLPSSIELLIKQNIATINNWGRIKKIVINN